MELLYVGDKKQEIKRIRNICLKTPLQFNQVATGFDALNIIYLTKFKIIIVSDTLKLVSTTETIKRLIRQNNDYFVLPYIRKITLQGLNEFLSIGNDQWILECESDQDIINKLNSLCSLEFDHSQVNSSRFNLNKKFGINNIIGSSLQMFNLYEKLERTTHSNMSVLLQGESGSGKELIARLIHLLSQRSNKKYVSLNCAAIPRELMESELFGFEKGSFTGAHSLQIGKFEYADKGTLFLDEIADMDITLQSKILRILEQQEFERIGSNTTLKTDVRIISATNKNLREEILAKRFREDLYYRLNRFPIAIPALRERKDDLLPLITYIMTKLNKDNNQNIKSFEMSIVPHLDKYHWPGNIRELENILAQSVLFTKGHVLLESTLLEVLDDHIRTKQSSQYVNYELPTEQSEILPLVELEKRAIVSAIQITRGNVTAAANKLGISRITLWRKMEKYNIKEIIQKASDT